MIRVMDDPRDQVFHKKNESCDHRKATKTGDESSKQ